MNILKKNLESKTLFILLLVLPFCCFSQPEKKCQETFIDGSYVYKNPKFTAQVTIKNNYHFERFDNDMIKSKMEWLSECQLKLTIIKCTIKGIDFKMGDFIVINITEIRENEFTYTTEFNGNFDHQVLIKIK